MKSDLEWANEIFDEMYTKEHFEHLRSQVRAIQADALEAAAKSIRDIGCDERERIARGVAVADYHSDAYFRTLQEAEEAVLALKPKEASDASDA